jgi:hypothetical protein
MAMRWAWLTFAAVLLLATGGQAQTLGRVRETGTFKIGYRTTHHSARCACSATQRLGLAISDRAGMSQVINWSVGGLRWTTVREAL